MKSPKRINLEPLIDDATFSTWRRIFNGLQVSVVSITTSLAISFVFFTRGTQCLSCTMSMWDLLSDSWFHVFLIVLLAISMLIGYSYKYKKNWDEAFKNGDNSDENA